MAIHYIQVRAGKQSIASPSFPLNPGLTSQAFYPSSFCFKSLGMLALFGCLFFCYSDCLFALEEGDKVKELAGLTAETSKLVKNGCYIAGSASALVGAIWSVASQSLKVAASSAAITIVALKAAGFFAGTLFI